ncbi:MAG: class I SAM-dependent methyltransferase [Paludibacteraceae bacterium]|nr:class I SAM-dependent methyltransferase [Paludibacteraceae bacterium]
MKGNKIFQIFTMFHHHVTAWNTGGEGVHSPRLFYIVRHLFYDTSSLYSWTAIEQRRQAMLRAPKLVHINDYGTGCDRDELVMHIAKRSLMGRHEAQLLARLLHYMSGEEYVVGRKRPLLLMELGTSLGVTTAYMATASDQNMVVTFEGSEQIAAVATKNWEKLGVENITLKLGNIDNTLYTYARELANPIDFVLMDANHTGEATLRYFEWLLPHMDENGVLVVDDIRLSMDMYKAWQQIVSHPKVTATMDLGRMGLVFFYPQLEKKLYRLRA